MTLRLFCIVALGASAMPLPAAGAEIPAGFRGDYCDVKGKPNLYRRGRCADGIRITADGYSHKQGRCRVTATEEGPKALLATFECRAKNDPEIEHISLWMRFHKRDVLNMWVEQ